MKLFIKFMMFAVVLTCAAPFVLKRSDGTPWLSLTDLKTPDIALPDISPLTNQIKKLGNTDPENNNVGQTTVYKWQDKGGVWHFSDKASNASPSEEIKINHNTNLVHLDKQESPVKLDQIASDEIISRDEDTPLNLEAGPYEQLPDLIDQAKNVENLLNQRQQQQEKILKQLGN